MHHGEGEHEINGPFARKSGVIEFSGTTRASMQPSK
jgi:hypothetical protein